jgi:hypothetical protein
MKYFIERAIGAHSDTLEKLWEGNDLPLFSRNGHPYCFSCYREAQRVLWRLQARYSVTIDTPRSPSVPIAYSLESIDTSVAQEYRPQQHLGMFV